MSKEDRSSMLEKSQSKARKAFSTLLAACFLSLMLLAALAVTDTDTPAAQAMSGFPDWSKAGYMGGAGLPSGSTIVQATAYGVVAGDNQDDSAALQAAIDANKGSASLKVLQLPAG